MGYSLAGARRAPSPGPKIHCWDWVAMEDLATRQLRRLLEAGVDRVVINALAKKLRDALARARGLSIEPYRTPLLPVLPETVLDPEAQLRMLDRYCRLKVAPNGIYTDWTGECSEPYWIVDIADEAELVGHKPVDATRFINRLSGRARMSLAETISLCLHTMILNGRGVYATGSSCANCFWFPAIAKDMDTRRVTFSQCQGRSLCRGFGPTTRANVRV